MRLILSFAILALLAVACNAKKTGKMSEPPVAEGAFGRLDLVQTSQDLKTNRTAAFTKYMGKDIEFEVNLIEIKEKNRLGMSAVFSDPNSQVPGSENIGYIGYFAFGDRKNEQLQTLTPGMYRGKIRGTIAGFAAGATPGYEYVELRPAWQFGELKPAVSNP